ncbi:sigma-70 family RNA polymerase sigma factor [Enterovirga sp.]|uniref:RNA polymerase sigma factor n=1 Tax=Enterovirga sp. TaxID=2026350 RepID=UPI0026168D54|nr:sigma-70 family RNA polymerase sigma factor [Enterovirga sp.]MDB5590367.1 polymerase subunit sigma-24 [Enterovirga sp.]
MDEVSTRLERHIPALRRYAWALLRDREAADDLVQDCLERAVGRWALRRRDGDLRAWLFAILHNLFIDGLRRRRREGLRVDLDHAAELPSPGSDPESATGLRDVLAALDTLPSEQRAVILLVGVEELSYEAAARVLAVPIGTVMSRLSRGRERLRRALEPAPAATLRRIK